MIRFTFLSVKSHQVAAGWCTRNGWGLIKLPNGQSTSNRLRFDVDITWRPFEDQISTNFHVIFMYFCDVILLIEKSMSFPCTFFEVILMVEKSTLFPRYFFRCNFDGRKIHLASTCFFDVISFIEISMCFYLLFWCNFDGRIIRFVCTYFFRWNFDEFDVVVGKL